MTSQANLTKSSFQRVATGFEALCKKACLNQLKKLEHGHLFIEDDAEVYSFGGKSSESLCATVIIEEPAAWPRILLGGSIGASEAYILGQWSSPNLTHVMQLFVKNIAILDAMETGLASISTLALKAYHLSRKNTVSGAKENIVAHYDLGNDLFRLFLDPTMMYSSAIFNSESDSLETASIAKLDRICKKLKLAANDRLLEIGTGWGSFAIHAAKYYGCHVTTTTISEEQYQYARKRIQEENLEDKITLLKSDYRQLTGKFTKLVSIEMIEAVGPQFMATYFNKCAELLEPNGLALIQAITILDQRYQRALKNVDFIQRYIFPGGFLPSVTAMSNAATENSDLHMVHLEDITPHYAKTLRHWHANFMQNKAQILSLGKYDNNFIRMWDYYFCYCEGGFLERYIGTVQIVFSKPSWMGEPILANF